MRPPNYAKSIEIKNSTNKDITVTVTFKSKEDDGTIDKKESIPAGAALKFEEQIKDMGSWTAIIPVHKVTVSHEGCPDVEHRLEVVGIVDTITKEVTLNESGCLSVA